MKDGSGQSPNHPFRPKDMEYPLPIAGDHRQAHHRFCLFQPPHREAALVHAAFHRADRMLDEFLMEFQLPGMQQFLRSIFFRARSSFNLAILLPPDFFRVHCGRFRHRRHPRAAWYRMSRPSARP
ncbi:MAG: hypothetical protein JW748_07695 [Anaerolineales bacterium]|nr:hypothetical protein [Anaerolineales bacterium]